MKILYGVNGEGMGHATRSQVVIENLLQRHDVRVVTSGNAYTYLHERLPKVEQIFGPTFAMKDGEIERWHTFSQNVRLAAKGVPDTFKHWMATIDHWRPDVVITDFEPLSARYAFFARVPLLAIDNMHVLDRCRHDDEIVGNDHNDFRLAKAVVRSMVPGAVEYIITTFFVPPTVRKNTELVPPIVRPEIVAAKPERGDHLVVYYSGDESQLDALRSIDVKCLVYGMRGGVEQPTVDGNIEFRPRSGDGFVEALRTARAIVAGGGFSLMSEAVYLGKPMLCEPLQGQFEQTLNARYLQQAGYGLCAGKVTSEILNTFVDRLPEFEQKLAGYEQDGNSIALAAIEETVGRAADSKPRQMRKARRTARRRLR